MWDVEWAAFYRSAHPLPPDRVSRGPLSYGEILGRKIETANRPKGVRARARETVASHTYTHTHIRVRWRQQQQQRRFNFNPRRGRGGGGDGGGGGCEAQAFTRSCASLPLLLYTAMRQSYVKRESGRCSSPSLGISQYRFFWGKL